MKKFIIILVLFLNSAYAQCVDQDNFNYSYIINKNDVQLVIERKDKGVFQYFKKYKDYNQFENTKFWFSVNDDEITIDSNIMSHLNIEWYYHLYDSNKLEKITSILNNGFFIRGNKIIKSFKINSLIESTMDDIEYPNEKRNIKIYTILFHNKSLSCSYFESRSIELDFKEINENYKNRNIFKPNMN